MATVNFRRTAVICATNEEFDNLTRLRQLEGVDEYFFVSNISDITVLEDLTNAIYLKSAKQLADFEAIAAIVNEKGITQQWR